jgi:hypothetical protein
VLRELVGAGDGAEVERRRAAGRHRALVVGVVLVDQLHGRDREADREQAGEQGHRRATDRARDHQLADRDAALHRHVGRTHQRERDQRRAARVLVAPRAPAHPRGGVLVDRAHLGGAGGRRWRQQRAHRRSMPETARAALSWSARS